MPLKVTKRHNSPNWYLRGTVCGIPVDETTSTRERQAAEQIRIAREAAILQRHIHGSRETVTFMEAAVLYLDSGGEPRYLANDKRLVNNLGSMPLARIDQAAIDGAARSIYPGSKPSTINRQVYTPVSAVMRYAAKRKLCDVVLLDRPRQPAGRIRWLTPDEAARLIHSAAPHLQPLLLFLFGTGARLSEALYLNWRDMDLSRAHVTFADTKNNEARGVPLHPSLIAALASLGHREGAVFRRPDGAPYVRPKGTKRGGQISTAFGTACRNADIENFRPHDCRHTWATWYYAANRDLNGLMRLGGWKSERMVLRYAHVNVGELAASIAALPLGGETWDISGESTRRAGKSL